VLVDGREWRRVDSFLGAGPGDQVYVVRQDDAGDSHVQTGDGVTGRRLPSGINNVVARFRVGAGAHGELRPESSARGGRRLPGLDRFLLPGVVAGGEPAESAEVARRAAPGKLQSLGRLVSLSDYEAEALALPGVEECAARWDQVDGVAAIVITVLMERGRDAEIEATRQALLEAERCRGPRRHRIEVRQGGAEYVYLGVSFALRSGWRREAVEPAIEAALGLAGTGEGGGLFGPRARRFGQPEYVNRILGVVQNLAGVRWAAVDTFGSLGVAASIDELVLPSPLLRAARIDCRSDRLLRLDRSDSVPALVLTLIDGMRTECEP
ncbi:MAG TPA: hypothetical protein VL172_20595, partial [Kofleriaceae bacterium]|nr:hypothetical protein [Kofleriaceae bacterium]